MKITETSTGISISINYDLKDAFRAIFKTAKWNPIIKCWDVKNTATNKSKLELFRKHVEESGIEQLIDESDNIEASEREFADLTEHLNRLQSQRATIQAIRQSAEALSKQLASVKSSIAETAIKAKAEKEVADEFERNNGELLIKILRNYMYEGCCVESVILKAGHALRLGHRGKSDFQDYQAWLAETNKEIQSRFKVKFIVLQECAEANFNRADRDGKWFGENILESRYVEVLKPTLIPAAS